MANHFLVSLNGLLVCLYLLYLFGFFILGLLEHSRKYKNITNASTRFATFGILGFFEFTVLSGKFELNLYGSKRVMQALCE
ncbi:hypothetical protein VFFQA001_14800 [Aliivibrio fischeri]|nr:hypothetical protein VFFQA001_14800 [Aliivibrio fischeri]